MEIRGLSTEIKEGVERAAVSHALKGIGAGVYLAQTHRIRIFLQLPPPPCYLNRSPFQPPRRAGLEARGCFCLVYLDVRVASKAAIAFHHVGVPGVHAVAGAVAAILVLAETGHASTGGTKHDKHNTVGNKGFEGHGHGGVRVVLAIQYRYHARSGADSRGGRGGRRLGGPRASRSKRSASWRGAPLLTVAVALRAGRDLQIPSPAQPSTNRRPPCPSRRAPRPAPSPPPLPVTCSL